MCVCVSPCAGHVLVSQGVCRVCGAVCMGVFVSRALSV